MAIPLETVVSIYRSLAQIPALTSANIYNKGKTIITTWMERNPERNKSSKLLTTLEVDAELNVVKESPFPIDITNELLAVPSPSEKYKALFRQCPKDSKNQYLEIWTKRHMKECIDLSALEIHGEVYVDSEFGSLSWDNSESKIIYIAERKLPKSESFCKRKPIKPKVESDTSDTPTPTVVPGNEYEYKAEWDEQLVGKHLSSLIICDLKKIDFTVVDWLPASWCPGQVLWAPDDKSIVGVAWETEPRRFGLIFCTNRKSCIFNVTLDGKYQIISRNNNAVRSPRFSNDGKWLFWLQRTENGPHHSGHQLVKTAWPPTDDPIVEIVIDKIETEIAIEGNNKFTGIYSERIVKRSFANDGKRLIFSTPQETEARTYVVDSETKKITDISDKSFPSSTIVLDVHDDLILASRSSLKQPAQLIMAKLPAAGLEQDIKWVLIDPHSIQIDEVIASAKLEYMNLEHEGVTDTTKKFSAIFFGDSSRGLIVWPHGGPHSSFINSYSLEAAFFYLLGFSIVQVNYRGSTGAGEKSLMYLPGRVGDADVKDCVLATDEAVLRYSLNEDKCVLLGGSHGGFLIGHLSGQYPDKYKAVFSRNPVIDIASMINGTDIPDWCTVEVGLPFNDVGPASAEILSKMRDSSPLIHAHKVKAPTLLCLGSNDRRVPYHQGIEFFHKIQANGCKARMLIYEDNHSLSSVEVDHLINGSLWLLEHTK